MPAQRVIDDRQEHRAIRRAGGTRLVQLGWPHFWLLGSILAGMLALVALVFFVQLTAS